MEALGYCLWGGREPRVGRGGMPARGATETDVRCVTKVRAAGVCAGRRTSARPRRRVCGCPVGGGEGRGEGRALTRGPASEMCAGNKKKRLGAEKKAARAQRERARGQDAAPQSSAHPAPVWRRTHSPVCGQDYCAKVPFDVEGGL